MRPVIIQGRRPQLLPTIRGLSGSEWGPVALPVFKTGRCPRNGGRAGFDSQARPPFGSRTRSLAHGRPFGSSFDSHDIWFAQGGLVIYGAILASGSSTRMGRAKALLQLPGSGRTFVAQVADTLIGGGVDVALVVGRPDDEALRVEVGTLGPLVRYVENPRYESGQLSSVLAALDVVDQPTARGLLIVPVDMPLIRATTIATLLDAFNTSPQSIARATHRGRHGHPVIFGRAAFGMLRIADPAQGARAVVRALPVHDVEVDDDGVVRDIDTPADYAELLR